jgi:hypothetical protein
MGLRDLVERYRSFDPATGEFTAERGLREYAAMLGVHPSMLSRFLNKGIRDSRVVLDAFLRTFPQATQEVGSALLAGALSADAPAPAKEAEHVPA